MRLKFVKKANLPGSPVTQLLVDKRAAEKVSGNLKKLGINPILIDMHPELYEAVAGHPDMSVCYLGEGDLVYAPGISMAAINEFKRFGINAIEGKTHLKRDYPGDIAYNVAIVGNVAFHNFRHTDEKVKEILAKKNIKMINVKQGYAKCSVCVVGDRSIITDDAGIARAAERVGLDTLFIGHQHTILLPGFDYGFIGGATGLIDRNIIVFTGNIDFLPSKLEITKFLKKNNVIPLCLSDGKVIDAGSLIPVMCL
jgi:hypothetical protein